MSNQAATISLEREAELAMGEINQVLVLDEKLDMVTRERLIAVRERLAKAIRQTRGQRFYDTEQRSEL